MGLYKLYNVYDGDRSWRYIIRADRDNQGTNIEESGFQLMTIHHDILDCILGTYLEVKPLGPEEKEDIASSRKKGKLRLTETFKTLERRIKCLS